MNHDPLEVQTCLQDLEAQLQVLSGFNEDVILIALASELGRSLRQGTDAAMAAGLAQRIQANLEAAALGKATQPATDTPADG